MIQYHFKNKKGEIYESNYRVDTKTTCCASRSHPISRQQQTQQHTGPGNSRQTVEPQRRPAQRLRVRVNKNHISIDPTCYPGPAQRAPGKKKNMKAPSSKLQAATFCRALLCHIDRSSKHQAPATICHIDKR